MALGAIDDEGEIVPEFRFDLRVAVELDDCVRERSGREITEDEMAALEDYVSTMRYRVSLYQSERVPERRLRSTMKRIARARSRDEQLAIMASEPSAVHGSILAGLYLNPVNNRPAGALSIGRLGDSEDITAAARFILANPEGIPGRGAYVKEWRPWLVESIMAKWAAFGGSDADKVWDNAANHWIKSVKASPLARWLSLLIEQIEGEPVDPRTVRALHAAYVAKKQPKPAGQSRGFRKRKPAPIAELNWNSPTTPLK